MSSTALAADPFVENHDPGPGHPEQAARFTAVLDAFEASGLLPKLVRLAVGPAPDGTLALVHSEAYIERARYEIRHGYSQLSTGDTNVCLASEKAACLAAGSAIAAVDAVFSRQAQNAFCLVRPPGHHASQARGMGFCIYNNVAIAARHAQKKWGAERVLIVDWDVHHGNGTQDIFYRDGSVLFFSTHQSPWYPGTGDESESGEGPGAGTTLNCPLPAGSGRDLIFEAFDQALTPAADAFHPDLVLISAGFDSRIGDPLGHFLLTDGDFRDLTTKLLELAGRYCSGRLVSVLEGGYNLRGLASATTGHVETLRGA